MKFLAIADRHPGEDPRSYLAEENRRVQELTDAHLVEQFYLKADRSGAVLVLEAESLDAAKAAMESLALFRRGMLDVAYTELIVPD